MFCLLCILYDIFWSPMNLLFPYNRLPKCCFKNVPHFKLKSYGSRAFSVSAIPLEQVDFFY